MKHIRSKILDVAYPYLKAAGKIHAPLSQKKIKQRHVEEVLKVVECGDLLLSRDFSSFTNLIIPGYYTHLAIYTDAEKQQVVESVDPKVKHTGIYDFMMTKDVISVIRPKFATHVERLKACMIAETYVGEEYDYQFYIPNRPEETNSAFYCAELAYWSYKMASKSMDFELRKTLGIDTVTVMDFYNATKHWEHVYETRSVK